MRSVLAMLAVHVGLAGCGSGADVTREVGARCDTAAECDDRCLPPSAQAPGGFCSTTCADAGDCPGDTTCVDRDAGICLFTCFADADCRFLGEGWGCRELRRAEDPTRPVKACLGS